MADFMYIFRGSQPGLGSPEEMQQHMQKWQVWMKELSQKGQFKSGDPLEASGKVLKGTKKVVTDGPFAEAKDLVGGYLVVKADDLEGAAEIAKGCPIFEAGGSVEIRPVMLMRT
jgi:hypothetical protein